MENVSLLFDRGRDFLGEYSAYEGTGKGFLLTAEGERQIGAHITEWQTRGVPALREAMAGAPDGHRDAGARKAFFQERVLMRDTHFTDALRNWLERHAMACVSLHRGAMECWEILSRLPLESRERFAMVLAMKEAPTHELVVWRETLSAASRAVAEERQSTERAVAELWKKTAKNLAAAFTKTKAAAC